MGLRDKYSIKPISYKLAMETVVKNHYLHRKCPCSHAFGLYEMNGANTNLFDNERLVGVIIYGTPSSAPLRKGICGYAEIQQGHLGIVYQATQRDKGEIRR